MSNTRNSNKHNIYLRCCLRPLTAVPGYRKRQRRRGNVARWRPIAPADGELANQAQGRGWRRQQQLQGPQSAQHQPAAPAARPRRPAAQREQPHHGVLRGRLRGSHCWPGAHLAHPWCVPQERWKGKSIVWKVFVCVRWYGVVGWLCFFRFVAVLVNKLSKM